MDSTRLYELFRSDVVDTVKPYLWVDAEVWAYMDFAYKSFVRQIGGVPDFTSDITRVSASAGEPTSTVSTKILRVMSAQRESDGREVEILNQTDLTFDKRVGRIRGMVIGMQRGVVRWVDVPEADEVVSLSVYRTPLNDITGEGQSLGDVDDTHHIQLLLGMKALAYRKQDAETFDRARSVENEALFERYCQQVRADMEREKHKTRIVAYGGI